MTTPIRDSFLQGMSRAAQTVNIVTTDGPAGRAGVTVSAMASVSADTPQPTLLVCVHELAQAVARSGTDGHNKGAEAAAAALRQIVAARWLEIL